MQFDDVVGAAAGRQDHIRDANGASIVGVALDPGTHIFDLVVPGAGDLDVTLTLGSHTGTGPTAKLYASFVDGSQKGTATNFNSGSALADATPVLASFTIGQGTLCRVVKCAITVPAASSATFSRAELAFR